MSGRGGLAGETKVWYDMGAETNGEAGIFMPAIQPHTIAGREPASRGSGNRPPFVSATMEPRGWLFVLSGES
jgi:hypothetical protein